MEANAYLEQNYPQTGTCQINKVIKWPDCYVINNFGKKRSEITHLALHQQQLTGSLDLTDFVNLEGLNCSRNQINELILKDNSNLKEIYCWNNQLTNITLSLNAPLKILECSNNQIKELNLENNANLRIINCANNQLSSLELNNYLQLEKLTISNNKLITLDLTDCPNLQELKCSDNQLSSLELNHCVKLVILSADNNQLTKLILPTPNQLEKIDVANNFLTTFPYQALNPLTLRELMLENNHLSVTDIQIFTSFVNLDCLSIGNSDAFIKEFINNSENHWLEKYPHANQRSGYEDNQSLSDNYENNKFHGSLQSFQTHSQLTELYLYNTNIQIDLQYLPLSLQKIYCAGQMWDELTLYGNNLQLWQAYHPALMEEAKKAIVELDSANWTTKKTFISFSPQGIKEIKDNLEKLFSEEPNNLQQLSCADNQHFNYSSFLLSDFHPFRWENIDFPKNKVFWKNDSSLEINSEESDNSLQLKKQLPLRLYNLATQKVVNPQIINSKGNQDIANYLILSYCWGTDWEDESQSYGQSYSTSLTKSGRQALNKVISTWQFLKEQHNLNTDYIWIDNFCINQSDRTEKGQEVRKQRNYYSNAAVTLIAIEETIGTKLKELMNSDEFEFHRMIINKILTSTWFSRSWTFQEGVLSRNTIFMFNDCLVDGRKLALFLGGNNGSYNSTPLTYITPLGHSFGGQSKDDSLSSGDNENQSVNLSEAKNKFLCEDQTNREINLSLGEALGSITHRSQTVSIDSIYSILGLLPYGNQINVEYKEDNKYSILELEAKLSELITQAYLYNPKEIMTYLGERNLTNWWLPLVQENGSTFIEGSLDSDERMNQYWLSQIQQITQQGIQLKGHYTLLANGNKTIELDCNDNNNLWNKILQFTLPPFPQPIEIKQVEQWYHSAKKQRTNIFIDMLNREVILETENPILYCQQTKSLETKIDLFKKNLIGSLNLSEFINLEEVHCYQNNLTSLVLPTNEKIKRIYCGKNQISKIEVNNFPNLISLGVNNNNLIELDISDNHKLTWLNCGDNQLTSLELSNNLELETLYCSSNNLEQINLTNNINLKKLSLGYNKLSSLDLTALVELEVINVNDCYLTSFNYETLNHEILTRLNISDNNLSVTDIAVFSQFINLKTLWIGSEDKERIQNNIYNRFYGSLEPWKKLTNLKSIHISNTDINSGVEFLPTSIEKIFYSTKERPACQLKQIEAEITVWLARKEIIAEQANLVTSVEQISSII